jgi:hypothetical protein
MRAAVAHQSCDQMFQRRKVSSGDHITAAVIVPPV